MENKNQLLNEVYNNQSKYPPCILSTVEYILTRKKENKNACALIKSQYKDIWNDYIKRPKNRISKMNYSIFLADKYGRSIMSDFYSLKDKTNRSWNDILRYDLKSIIYEIKLIKFDKNELSDFLANLSEYNKSDKNIEIVDNKYRNYIFYIAPLRLSEILLFLLVNNE